MFDDDLLRTMYVEYDIPCDPLVRSPADIARFTSDYTHRSGHAVTSGSLARYLHNMRKRGEAKGGLPKLRRAYNGRN